MSSLTTPGPRPRQVLSLQPIPAALCRYPLPGAPAALNSPEAGEWHISAPELPDVEASN